MNPEVTKSMNKTNQPWQADVCNQVRSIIQKSMEWVQS
jgi:hypothetical protein